MSAAGRSLMHAELTAMLELDHWLEDWAISDPIHRPERTRMTEATYMPLREERDVHRTITINPGLLVDLDADGRVLGVESIGEPVGHEQLAAVLAHIQIGDRGPDVAGAVANLLRATDPADPGYEKLRQAYGVALEAAGLVPEETP